MRFRAIAAVIAIACGLPACGGISSPSNNTVQTFPGVFEVGSSGPVHDFSASRNGEFFVTLTSLTPDSTAIVAVSFGQRSAGGCGLITSTFASVGRQALGGPLDKGSYCVQVADSGLSTLTGAQTYSLRVSAP